MTVAGDRRAWHARPMHRLRACLFALAVLPLAGWEPLWRLDPDVAAGNQAYREGRYDDALAAYDRAEDSGVDPAGLAYDRGTALLGQAEAAPAEAAPELFGRAFALLGRATSGRDARIKARAHYNRGTIVMRAKQLDDAIEEYKNALRADPLLESARSNLELALRQREKQRKQQQQRGQGQGPGQGQPPPQPGQQGQPGPGQGQPQPGSGQQPQPGQQGQPQPQPGQQGQPGQQPQPPQPGQQGQGGPGQRGSTPRRMPPAQWPHDDTESDTPDTGPGAKLDQLEDMSRQLRRDQVKSHNADGSPDQDW